MLNRQTFTKEDLERKEAFCAMVVSNANGAPERLEILDNINRYKQVSMGGRWKNNVGGPVIDKIAFQKKHKFVIAFENESYPGYTTEKLMEAFCSNAIPIYWGDPMVDKTFNPKAFINCMQYESFEKALLKIKEIDGNDELYCQMMNENPLLDMSQREKELDLLESFLFNIFDKDSKELLQFSRCFRGRLYREHYRALEETYNKPWSRLLPVIKTKLKKKLHI